jgi:hypothetical protein
VSVKGVVPHAGRYLLALNDRGEWELPGGQLEETESPEQGVAYGCTLISSPAELSISAEHAELRFFARRELAGIALPEGYRRAMADWPAT